MGVKDGFMGASLMVKISFILLLIANLFNWIAFTTASWGYFDFDGIANSLDGVGYGLWRRCGETISGCTVLDGTREDWYATFQAFGIFGFVGINVAFLLLILYMFAGPCKGNGEAKMATFIICFVAAVCWLIAVIIFAAEFSVSGTSVDKLGFSFALAIIALILAVVAGILLIVDGKGGGGTSPA
ncbi:hypothetical protein BaRGS_00004069 [Batillaria attramentaria]|uniref:MARVEL domain-containing protein n=1 Tax=Batillaria attramentaria TaxID=370345 RepID=A0ABD0LZL3_9CAEN